MGVNINLLPKIRIARSDQKEDEDDKAIARMENDFDDINSTSKKTDKANPNGVVVRCTPSGEAVYNDNNHQVVFGQDGRITVLDRDTGGSENLTPNFTIKDGFIYHRNPNYDPKATKSPEKDQFLKTEIPDEGMELILSEGTTMFITKNGDGTLDVKIANVDSTAEASTVEENAGVLTSFNNVGSGQPFKPGFNASGAATGGKAFVDKWEATHDDGHKGGTVRKVWVTPMTADTTRHGGAHRVQGKESDDWDQGQGPGGFSLRSDEMYDYDKDDSRAIKEYGRWYFWDLASHNAPVTETVKDPATGQKTKQETYAGTTGVDASDPNIQFLLAAENPKTPLFANPNNPDQTGVDPYYGDPIDPEDSDDTSNDGDSGSTNSSHPTSSGRSRTMSLTDYLGTLSYDSFTNRRDERGESY